LLDALIMTVALLHYIWRIVNLSWLIGPIFDKELRVSSRRRRNYLLRFVYLTMLTIFLVLMWQEEVRYGGSAVYTASRMAQAGQVVIASIVWFQFCAIQIVAMIMLSTSISDEIYNRTLGILMTCPVNSFQIVMGKLFSKLLQLILLLAISLPLLAVVRVFGGVPWGYVLSSLCITLTTGIFVGSVSLLFSIFSRRVYVVIIATVLALGAMFALAPLLVTIILREFVFNEDFLSVVSVFNPYFSLVINTELMMSPRRGGPTAFLSWPTHCAIMLGASTFILALSVTLVRRVALRQAAGEPSVPPRRYSNKSGSFRLDDYKATALALRRVKGPPVLWKELRTALLGRHKKAAYIIIFAGIALLIITYSLCAREHILDDVEVHILYGIIFLGLGMLFTIILPATTVASEKESRTWALLLTTPLSGWQIILGKFIGALRRSALIWLFLFGHIVLFSLMMIIHPVCIVQMAILVAGIVIFLIGTGLYFSARLRHTTAAVIANFALAAAVWGLIPLLMVLILNIVRTDYNFVFEVCLDTNPFVQTTVIMDAATRMGSARSYRSYNWLFLTSLNATDTTLWMLLCMMGYISLGLLFTWRAKNRLRRNIF